jgi:hypothetical protein
MLLEGGARVRLAIAICAVLGTVSAAPAAASACASLAGVHSFHGHALLSFDGSASGPVEGTGGSETISLMRRAASLKLDLTHKTVGKGDYRGFVTFSGKARLGNVTVDDSFTESGSGSAASETYNGPALSTLGSASVVLDTNDCLYAVTVTVGAKTMFSGDGSLQPGAGVFVSAVGDRNRITRDLHLIGGVGPDAYLRCPGDPLLSGHPCFQLGGGWATDFAELKQCGSYPPQGNCASSDKPVGDGKFIWVLKPQ